MILKEMKGKNALSLYKGFLKRGKAMEGRQYQEIMKRYGIEI